MKALWKLLAEVLVQPGDMPSGLTKGFVNVLIWADSAESARDRLERYIEGFEWRVISIENPRTVADDEEFAGEEMEEMLMRARGIPNAIILGTFHAYREN